MSVSSVGVSGGAAADRAVAVDDLTGSRGVSHVVLAGSMRAVDATLVALVGGALYLFLVSPAIGYTGRGLALALAAGVGITIALNALDAYDVNRMGRLVSQLWRCLAAWIGVLIATVAVAVFVDVRSDEARLWFVTWFAGVAAGLVVIRAATAVVIDGLAKAGRLDRRAVIVGGGRIARELMDGIARSSDSRIRILGVFDDREQSRPSRWTAFRCSAPSTISSPSRARTASTC